MKIKDRFEKIIAHFEKEMPEAQTELNYTNPYELLVAVVLSAQCTDKRVNMLTPAFFKKFPTVNDLANASIEEVFELIKSCSYPNNKSKHLYNAANMIVDEFNGEIPDNAKDLQKLPGVGRKTANVMLSVVFNTPAMAVDTHVFRVSARLGLTKKAKTPEETEKQLVKYIPEEKLSIAHHWLILHGRYVCIARKPLCKECKLKELCAFYDKSKQ